MWKIISIVLVLLLTAAFIFPVIATITNSFMTGTEIAANYTMGQDDDDKTYKISIVPAKATINQYYELLIEKYKYLNMFWNSVKLSVIITFIHVVLAVLSAYVFAKLQFKGRDILFFIYIVVMMMPFQVTLLPNYIIVGKLLNIQDSHLAIILPGIFVPFGVFLLRQFMKYIPDEYLEAVTLESNSVFTILRVAILPACKPGIMALTVLTFAENWNMVEQPLVFLEDPLKYPLSVALNSIIQESAGIAFAGSVIFMIPIIILYFYFEEHIIQGISTAKF